MKISINSQFITGPYGGAIHFANYLRDFLTAKNIKVINHLQDDDIDLILNVNPFPFLTRTASAYSFFDAYAYRLLHPQTIIITRINECDERKGTGYMNQLLIKAATMSDVIVYIGSWLKPLLEAQGMPKGIPSAVILNGADEKIFNTDGKVDWDGKEKLKVVTHHWSSNLNKGHAIYEQLDNLLNDPEFSKKFSFTYVGATPKLSAYKNARMVAPLSGKELADELKQHHVYITATINEPGGMHHIEGALCGLPLLYINSGALPEYCVGFGIEFKAETLAPSLGLMRKDYAKYRAAMKQYIHTAKHMSQEYLDLFEQLVKAKKHSTAGNRRLFAAIFVRLYGFVYAKIWRVLWRLKK